MIYNLIDKAELTPVEIEIGNYILENKELVLKMTINQLASKIFVSKSSIHRFCKKIGFNGYNDLKVVIAKNISYDVDINFNYPFKKNDVPKDIGLNLMKIYDITLKDTYELLDNDELMNIMNAIDRAKIIDIYINPPNTNIALNFKEKMFTIGKIVNCPKNSYEQRLQALNSNNEHLAIFVSYSGKARFINPLIEILGNNNVDILMIGNSKNSKFKYLIELSSKESIKDRISQFSSQIAIYYIFDILFSSLYTMYEEINIEKLKIFRNYLDDRK